MPKFPIIKKSTFTSKIGPKERKYTAQVRVFTPKSIEFTVGDSIMYLTPEASQVLAGMLNEVNSELGLSAKTNEVHADAVGDEVETPAESVDSVSGEGGNDVEEGEEPKRRPKKKEK